MHIAWESWKRFWNAEEIRFLVLTSLCLQFFLVFMAPLRKRTAKKYPILPLWFFYLGADYIAILALGNLLKAQNEAAHYGHHGIDLMAFWAPFLLLHLGGPDTITSYSIEDNELWWRHFLGLALQVAVAFLVLLQLMVVPRLRVAAAFVFIAGLVKYSERTLALRSASMDQFRDSMVGKPDPGPDYANFMEEYVWRREAGQSAFVKTKNEPPPPPPLPPNPDDEGNVYGICQIHEAYEFFKRFKPLVVDLMLSFQERKDSQTYFWNCMKPQVAFKVVEIELSFLYDVFHTKAINIRGVWGCLWRFFSFGMICSAFILFLICEKRGYVNADIIISYVLLGSALFMELTSLVLIIISDWMIVTLKEHKLLNKLEITIAKVMSCVFREGKPRWSNSIGQYNLLTLSLGDKQTMFRRFLGAIKVKELWNKFIFVHSVRMPSKVKEALFGELKRKSKDAKHMTDFKELRDCKGEKALQEEGCCHLNWSMDKEFDESLLLWHIATDLCFHTNVYTNENREEGQGVLRYIRRLRNLCGRNENGSHSDREISLTMSNYMMYLLIIQPAMMPAGIGKIRFQNTCAEAKAFFRAEERTLTKAETREALLDVETEVDPIEVKGDRSKSVLFDACRLAKELNLLAEDERWRLIRNVWVEMLGYAAIKCKPYYHAKQLSQGGELLTHVWLLMAHMGIGEQYRIEAGHATATLAFSN